MRVLVDERRVRVADDLAVAVVLHHDHEHVVKPGDTLGASAPRQPRREASIVEAARPSAIILFFIEVVLSVEGTLRTAPRMVGEWPRFSSILSDG